MDVVSFGGSWKNNDFWWLWWHLEYQSWIPNGLFNSSLCAPICTLNPLQDRLEHQGTNGGLVRQTSLSLSLPCNLIQTIIIIILNLSSKRLLEYIENTMNLLRTLRSIFLWATQTWERNMFEYSYVILQWVKWFELLHYIWIWTKGIFDMDDNWVMLLFTSCMSTIL